MENTIPDRLSALGHPHRLDIFRLLMRRYPDRVPAGEIAAALGLPASSLSAYLCAPVPSLMGIITGETAVTAPAEGRRYKALVICTGNSARSIFAECILREAAGDRFDVFSAGTRAYSELNPFALEVLRGHGHVVSGLRAENVAEFQGEDAPAFDFVFTVCDRAANEECPPWPGQPVIGHWGVADPVKADGTDSEKSLAFQQAYGALANRIRTFAALLIAALDRIALQAAMDDIARTGGETFGKEEA